MLEHRVSPLNRRFRHGVAKILPVLSLLCAAALPLCFSQSKVVGDAASHGEPPGPRSPVSPSRIALGRAIFFDPRLSEPAGTSCASCHAPESAFASNNGSSIGVPRGSRPGHFAKRSAPSLLYLRYVPNFHFYQEDEAPQSAPYGGFFWDGRADSIVEVVKFPLLDPNEMNNRDLSQIGDKIATAP